MWPLVFSLRLPGSSATLAGFPEFVQDGKKPLEMYVMGGFGALGNPASFHNPFVRKLRNWIMHMAITQLFKFRRRYPSKIDALGDALDVLEQDRELVTAEAGEGVTRPQAFLEPTGDNIRAIWTTKNLTI